MPLSVAVRDLHPDESRALGQLMVDVYRSLPGFPSPDEQPRYYEMLANIGDFAQKPQAQVLVAVDDEGQVLGGVVYFGDIAQYGAALPLAMTDVSGVRLLAVHPSARGKGIGRQLMEVCIRLARESGHRRVVLHTTEAMRVAWDMYERMGFQRLPVLDFAQAMLPVFGFQLDLHHA